MFNWLCQGWVCEIMQGGTCDCAITDSQKATERSRRDFSNIWMVELLQKVSPLSLYCEQHAVCHMFVLLPMIQKYFGITLIF